MKRIYSKLTAVSTAFSKISGFLLFAWVFVIVADIIMRFVFSKPIIGTYELTELWLSVIAFAAFPFVQTQKNHIGVVMVIKALPHRVSMVVYAIANLVGVVTSALISYAAVQQAIRALNRNNTTDLLRIPRYPFYIFEAICMALFCIVLLVDMLICIYGVFDKNTCEEVRSHWV